MPEHSGEFSPADAIRLPPSQGRPRVHQRLVAAAGSLAAGALGAAPHVLHHAGPFAGAALLGGAAGSLLFGALGFALALPLLVRLRRRSGSWRLPVALLGLFAAVFALATLVVQPALSDDDSPASQRTPGAPGHEQHHP